MEISQTPPKIDPSSAALLVMDVEHATLKSVGGGADGLLTNIGNAIAVGRAHNLLVGYVRMALEDDELDALPDTNKLAGHMAASGTALHAESGSSAIPGAVAPEEVDIVVRKTRVGAFSTTDLHELLQQRGISTLFLAGISTSGVVLSTVRDAADRDYKVFVLRDASADPAPDVHEFLNERIFPSQAEVITVADFDAAFPAGKSVPAAPVRSGPGQSEPRQSGPGQSASPKVRNGLVPALVFIGMVVAILSSLGAPLVPALAKANHVSLITAQWTLTIAFLASAMATPTMGRIGDGPGRRKLIIAGLAVVTVGCVLAALPLGFPVLLFGRALQGIGLGLTPLTMATARDSLPKAKATPAVAMLSLTTVVGVGLGYPLTGLIVQIGGLHAAFWFGAAMSAVAFVIAWIMVPSSSAHKPVGRDIPGAVLLAGALALLLLAISEGPVWGWGSLPILAFFVLAVPMVVGWVLVEQRAAHPLVDVSLLRLRPVQTADVTAVLAGVGMYLLISLITRFMQTPKSSGYGLGSSVLMSGLVLVPFSVCSLLASRIATAMLKHMPPGRVLAVACAPMVAGLLLFAYGRGGGLVMLFVVMGIAGLGTGCIFDVMPQLIVNAVPSTETGSAISFNQVSRLLGYSTGSALSAIVLQSATHGKTGLPTDSGYTIAGVIGAVLWVVTAVFATILPGRAANKQTATKQAANKQTANKQTAGTADSAAKPSDSPKTTAAPGSSQSGSSQPSQQPQPSHASAGRK